MLYVCPSPYRNERLSSIGGEGPLFAPPFTATTVRFPPLYLPAIMAATNLVSCCADCSRTFLEGSSGLKNHRNNCLKYNNEAGGSSLSARPSIYARMRTGMSSEERFRRVDASFPLTVSSSPLRSTPQAPNPPPAPMEIEPIEEPVDPDQADPSFRTPTPEQHKRHSPAQPALLPRLRPGPRRLRPGTHRAARFLDVPPEPQEPAVEPIAPSPAPRNLPRVILIVRDKVRTAVNRFGLLREFLHRPTHDPEALATLESLSNLAASSSSPASTSSPSSHPAYYPHKNITEHLIMNWKDNGNPNKSMSEVDRFVRDVWLHPEIGRASCRERVSQLV